VTSVRIANRVKAAVNVCLASIAKIASDW
jgi:hypothetical protein